MKLSDAEQQLEERNAARLRLRGFFYTKKSVKTDHSASLNS